MTIYKEWKKDIENKLRRVDIERAPSLIKRCPKCSSLTLDFDPATGRIKCAKCGFQEYIPVFRK